MILRAIAFSVSLVLCAGAGAKNIPRPVLKLPNPAAARENAVPDFSQTYDGWPSAEVVAERKRCSKLLKGLDITYKPLAPIGASGGCGAAAPILIKSVRGTTIDPPAEATCELAEALHGWITSSLQPAARAELKKDVTMISNASAYVCRRRNGQSSGKLSEHAKANALDMAWLRFSDGSTTTIKGDWSGILGALGISGKSAFLTRIRRDACVRFTTVLGPGSDSFHKDHFHVDMARRKNGYRICQ